MLQQLQIVPLAAQYIDEVVNLSERLEQDPFPCSYWGLNQRDVSNLLANPQKYALIAISAGRVVGIGALARGQQFQQHLAEVSVAVCPEHRHQGIARQLLHHLEAYAAAWGIELLKALIWTANQPSRQLFASAGYDHRATLYAEFKSQQFGEIDDCVYYKRITRPTGAM